MSARQQINLYQERFREPRVLLPASQLALILAALTGVLLAASGYAWWSHGVQAQRLQALEAAAERDRAEVRRIQDELAQRARLEDLDEELRVLRAQRDARQRVMEYVATRGMAQAATLSEFLAGLARRHTDGVWLTRIALLEGGAEIRIEGSALDPDRLPRFLEGLGSEPSYRGRQFRTMTFQRPQDSDWKVDFLLSSAREAR